MSQAALGERGGVTKKSQLLYEGGSRMPDAAYLTAVAAAGVDVLFVLTGTRSVPVEDSLTEEERALLDNYKHADEEGRAAARRVLSSLAQSNAARKAA